MFDLGVNMTLYEFQNVQQTKLNFRLLTDRGNFKALSEFKNILWA